MATQLVTTFEPLAAGRHHPVSGSAPRQLVGKLQFPLNRLEARLITQ
jgi:hypothetical protein